MSHMGERVTPTGIVIYDGPAHTEEWHRARQGGIGGSDIPAIAGMKDYQSPTEIYLVKRGEAVPELPRDVLDMARWGGDMEALLARRFVEETGYDFRPAPYTIAHIQNRWMRCNLDGLIADNEHAEPDAIMEFKTRTSYQIHKWPRDGEPPPDVQVQTQWNLAVSGYQRAFIAAEIGHTFRWYPIYRDERVIAQLIEMAEEFWNNTQAGYLPVPDESEATAKLYTFMWDVEPEKIKTLTDGEVTLLLSRDSILSEIKALQRRKALIDNQIRHSLQTCEIGAVNDGGEWSDVVTWKQNGNFAHAEFSADYPDLAEQCLSPKLDPELVKAKFPEHYKKYRARALRINTRKLPDRNVYEVGEDESTYFGSKSSDSGE